MKKVLFLFFVFLLVGSFAIAQENFRGRTVTILNHGIHFEKGLLPHAEKWAQLNNAKVDMTTVAYAEIYQKVMMELVGRTGAYDIVMYMYPWGGTIAGAGHLAPLDEYIDKNSYWWKDITPANQKAGIWGGKVYGLVVDGDTHMFYYRKDLIENSTEKANFKRKYGYDLRAPKTWDEYLDVAEFFTRKKGQMLAGKRLDKDFYGTAELLGRSHVYWWHLTRFSHFAIPYFDLNTMKPQINRPESVRALQNMVDCLQFQPPGALEFGWPEGNSAYLNGDIAMIVIWTDTGKRTGDPNISQIVGKSGFGVVPGWMVDGKYKQRTFLSGGGWLYGIPRDAKNKNAAVSLLKYLSSPEVSIDYVIDYNTGLDPFRYSHFESTTFRNLFSNAGELLDAIGDNLETGWPELALPGAAEYNDVLGANVHRALTGELTPQEAMDQTAKEWEKITQKLGLEKQKKLLRDYLTPYLE